MRRSPVSDVEAVLLCQWCDATSSWRLGIVHHPQAMTKLLFTSYPQAIQLDCLILVNKFAILIRRQMRSAHAHSIDYLLDNMLRNSIDDEWGCSTILPSSGDVFLLLLAQGFDCESFLEIFFLFISMCFSKLSAALKMTSIGFLSLYFDAEWRFSSLRASAPSWAENNFV